MENSKSILFKIAAICTILMLFFVVYQHLDAKEVLVFNSGGSEIDISEEVNEKTNPIIVEPVNIDNDCQSNPPGSLLPLWQKDSSKWSHGIWGSENLISFTTGLAIVDTDHPDFGEFRLWLDPCKVDTKPGHGYKDYAIFWSHDTSRGTDHISQPIIIGKEILIKLPPNTGKYGLGNNE